MGQRVTFTLTKGEKELANAYYHWSGYTYPSTELLATIMDFFLNGELPPQESWTETDYLTYAINALQSTGAMFPQEQSANRNDGLIAILDDCEANKNWEANIYIDLENKEIRHLNEIMNVETYSSYHDWVESEIEDDGDTHLVRWDDLPTLDTTLPDVFNITFDEFKTWINEVFEVLTCGEGSAYYVWEDYAICNFG